MEMSETLSTLVFQLVNGLIWGCILALIALGLSLIFGQMGIVNMAHGELYMAGAVLVFSLTSLTKNFWLMVVVVAVIMGLLGGVAERFMLRPFEGKPMPSMVATIGLSFVMQQLALMWFGGIPKQMVDPWPTVVQLFGMPFPGYRVLVAFIAVLLIAVLWTLLHRTSLGTSIRACMQDAETANAMGINSGRISVITFGLGTALAALGGALSAPISQVFFLMGTDVVLFAFIVAIVGGLGSLEGTLVAAISLSALEGVLSVTLSPVQARAAIFLIMSAVLVVRPHGLFGRV